MFEGLKPNYRQLAIAFISIESALGLSLILNIFPQVLIPSSITLLIALSILTIWSISTGKTEYCGCYGGIVIVTPLQSILLNISYIAFLKLVRYTNFRF
ncbi:MauE/DoxX family redox-associated membrane protein [Dapis sp. BLCC M229]|uniref:MauE/DoxX family redox-associated membrane protein n=1 Tax=Dapis sp. BLCC M229 TaxID=3400188 RepID=UPI003CEA43F1